MGPPRVCVGGGGVFTISIAEEDHPRRLHALTAIVLTAGLFTPFTYWVALPPRRGGLGGRAGSSQGHQAAAVVRG